MSVLVSLVVYMMTLTSDILEDILSFKLEVIMQFPYILSSISLIILFILFILKDMEKIWYWLISIIMIAVISMSGHVGTTSAIMVNYHKNNSSYRASVMVRFTRLSHLLCY